MLKKVKKNKDNVFRYRHYDGTYLIIQIINMRISLDSVAYYFAPGSSRLKN